MNDQYAIDEMDLLALADGGYDDDPARKAELEAAIAQCPPASTQLAAYRAQTAALRAAYAGTLAEPVPDRLYDALDGIGRAQSRPIMRRTAAGLLVAAAGVGGWLIGSDSHDPLQQALLDESYRQFQLHDSNPAMAATVARGAPISWAEDGVAMRLSAPDLSSEGYTLVEKRAVPIGKDQIVVLEYMSQDDRAFSLFLTPRWADRPGPIIEQERDGVTLTYWHDGPLASSIATTLPKDQARDLARTVRNAMREDTVAPPAVLAPDWRLMESPDEGIMAETLGPQPALGSFGPGEITLPTAVMPN